MVRVQVLFYVHYWIQLNACSVSGTLFINVQIEKPHHHAVNIIGISKFKSNETTMSEINGKCRAGKKDEIDNYQTDVQSC